MLDLRKNLMERRMVELDPDLARHYLKFNTYKSQRSIRDVYVTHLADKMKKGLFRFGEVAFANMNGAGDLLINGQHVCSAVIESGISVPCMLEKFKISNDLELSQAFRQFELLQRGLNDMVKVEADALKLTWPNWISSLIVSAATIEVANQKKLGAPSKLTTHRVKKYMTKEDKVELLGHYLKEGAFLFDLLTSNGTMSSGSHVPHLCRKAVALIIMQSWRINSNDAGTFWIRVRDGENLKKTMPEMKLREFLMQTRSKVRPSAYAARSVSDHEYAYRCALAWNAFRTNKPTNLAYHPDNPIPKLK